MDDPNIVQNDDEPERKKRSWWRGWLLVLGTVFGTRRFAQFQKIARTSNLVCRCSIRVVAAVACYRICPIFGFQSC